MPKLGPMRVFGLAGWSGSGKTTLVTRLLPALLQRGVSVSTIKHAHHEFDIDKPGKDSWLHRQAGAREVMVASARIPWISTARVGSLPIAARRAGGISPLSSIRKIF